MRQDSCDHDRDGAHGRHQDGYCEGTAVSSTGHKYRSMAEQLNYDRLR